MTNNGNSNNNHHRHSHTHSSANHTPSTQSYPGLYPLKHLPTLPDLLVFNDRGMHHHNPTGHENSVGYVRRFARENNYYPYGRQRLLIYRETGSQGFPSVTGDYGAFKAYLKKKRARKKQGWLTRMATSGSGEGWKEGEGGKGGEIYTCRVRHFDAWNGSESGGSGGNSGSGSSSGGSGFFYSLFHPFFSTPQHPVTPSSSLPPLTAPLVTFRQEVERRVMAKGQEQEQVQAQGWGRGQRQSQGQGQGQGGIPVLRVFDVSVSLPCDGLGHVGK
jgi:hypothetical protein